MTDPQPVLEVPAQPAPPAPRKGLATFAGYGTALVALLVGLIDSAAFTELPPHLQTTLVIGGLALAALTGAGRQLQANTLAKGQAHLVASPELYRSLTAAERYVHRPLWGMAPRAAEAEAPQGQPLPEADGPDPLAAR